MKRHEHLLTILGEEADEVGQRGAKALRFGLAECQPGQPLDNRCRLEEELRDLLEVARMLEAEGHFSAQWREPKPEKRAQVERFLVYSAELGTLDEPSLPPGSLEVRLAITEEWAKQFRKSARDMPAEPPPDIEAPLWKAQRESMLAEAEKLEREARALRSQLGRVETLPLEGQ